MIANCHDVLVAPQLHAAATVAAAAGQNHQHVFGTGGDQAVLRQCHVERVGGRLIIAHTDRARLQEQNDSQR